MPPSDNSTNHNQQVQNITGTSDRLNDRLNLQTPAGMAAAVWVLSEASDTAFGFNPIWLALVLSIVVVFAVHYQDNKEKTFNFISILLIIINSCMVFFASSGANGLKSRLVKEPTSIATLSSNEPKKGSFLFLNSRSWFPPKYLEDENNKNIALANNQERSIKNLQESNLKTIEVINKDTSISRVPDQLIEQIDFRRGYYIISSSDKDSSSLSFERKKIISIIDNATLELSNLDINLYQSANIWPPISSDDAYKISALYGIKDKKTAYQALAILKKYGARSDSYIRHW